MRRRVWAILLAWVAPLAAQAGPLAAQAGPPSLARVDSMVAAGLAEEARGVLSRWWTQESARADRGDLQRAIWLRAVLTVDPTQAALDYQRLVLEHPGGAWSDRALLRLAQLAAARGDAAKARTQLRSLLRDYPGSPMREEASGLLRSLGTEAAAENVPIAETERVALGRAPGGWTVQLGAFASPERARALGREISAAGDSVRFVVVPPSRLVRVRFGRFPSQAAADQARRALIARGFQATLSDDADREESAP